MSKGKWTKVDEGDYATHNGRFKAIHARRGMWLLKDTSTEKMYAERTLWECKEVAEGLANVNST